MREDGAGQVRQRWHGRSKKQIEDGVSEEKGKDVEERTGEECGNGRVSNRICLICPERRLRRQRESIRIIFMNLILNSSERSYFTVTLSAALY